MGTRTLGNQITEFEPEPEVGRHLDAVRIRTGPAASQAEGATFHEDEQANGDEDQRQQDVAPAGEGLGDDGTGGEEVSCEAPHRHENEEHHGVDGHAANAGSGEDGDVDPDVVPAVGEGDRGDLQRAGAAFPGLLLLFVAVVLPRCQAALMPSARGSRPR